MINSHVFLDANVLLEIILARSNESDARKFLNAQTEKPCISALTAHLVVHFGQKIVELPILRKFLEDYEVLPLDNADFEWAFMNMRGNDFEDALQVAIAIRNGSSTFVTFDKQLVGNYKALSIIKTQLL